MKNQMNKPAHTPGPWILQPIRNDEKVIRYSVWKEEVDGPEDVVGSAYSLPNAHLIAAAPAMYHAGQLSLDVMERVAMALERMGNEGLRSIIRSAIIEQKAALAQAEGR